MYGAGNGAYVQEVRMELREVVVAQPEDTNVIIGQAHFIKTAEDLYEVMVNAHGQIRFGVAFCEASGPCLIRHDGNDKGLEDAAVAMAKDIACGHSFVIVMRGGFPINVLNDVKACREVCRVFCATANPLAVIVAESARGRGIMGVIDGSVPRGVEGEKERGERVQMLRKFGYKR
jgi:uncharacterized protein